MERDFDALWYDSSERNLLETRFFEGE